MPYQDITIQNLRYHDIDIILMCCPALWNIYPMNEYPNSQVQFSPKSKDVQFTIILNIEEKKERIWNQSQGSFRRSQVLQRL